MAERVELSGALDGRHIMVDLDRLTIGLLIDLESERATTVVNAVNKLVVGGDVGDLRDLRPVEFAAVIEAVAEALRPKKAD